MIRFYRLNELDPQQRDGLLQRAESKVREALPAVGPIVEGVRARGDAAVAEYTARFDGVELTPEQFLVQPGEFDRAREELSADMRQDLQLAAANILRVHEQQVPPRLTFTEVAPGILAGEQVTPISSVALYVPRGKGSFPSVMLMLATAAKAAGVPQVVACTPPGPDGRVDAACLYAAELCGVKSVYRVGGAQAIAAFAYSTEHLPRVLKIVGPGSPYVVAAKRLVRDVVDIGLPAGPSEAIILADHSASPELVAGDLLIEAEHGPDSASLLVTADQDLAEQVQAILPRLIETLPEPRRAFCRQVFAENGGIILAPTLEQAITFVNAYAPEHLEVLVRDPLALLPALENAGEILLGPYTPICLGNYCLGTNAILPTGGAAKTYSSTSVWDFLKRTGVAYADARGYQRLAPTTRRLAEYEGFPAHARAVTDRPLPVAQKQPETSKQEHEGESANQR